MSFLDSLRSHHVKNHQVDAFFKSNKSSTAPNIIVSCGSGAAESRAGSNHAIPTKVQLVIPGKQSKKTEKTQARVNELFRHIEDGNAEEAARLIKKLAPFFTEYGSAVGVDGNEESIKYANTLHDALKKMLAPENELLASGGKSSMKSGVYKTLTSFSRQMEPKQAARNMDARFDKQKSRFEALVKFHEGQLLLDPAMKHSATQRVAEHLRKARADFEATQKTVMAMRANAGAKVLDEIRNDKSLSAKGKAAVNAAYQGILDALETDVEGLPKNPDFFNSLVTALRADADANDSKLSEFTSYLGFEDKFNQVDDSEKQHVAAQALRAALVVIEESRAPADDPQENQLAVLLETRLPKAQHAWLSGVAERLAKAPASQPPATSQVPAASGAKRSALPQNLFV